MPRRLHTRWDVYMVDSNPRKSLEGLYVKPAVRVSLVAADGKTVVEEEVPLTDDAHRWLLSSNASAKHLNICLAPLALDVYGEYLDYKPLEMYRRSIKVTVGELNKVKDIKCVIALRPVIGEKRKRETMLAPPIPEK